MPKLLVLGLLAVVALVLTGGARAAELDYVERTSNLTVTSSTEAGADTVITSGSVSYDGTTKVRIEFFSPVAASQASACLFITLWDNTAGTDLGRLSTRCSGGVRSDDAVSVSRYLTPTAGSRVYSVRAWRTGGGNTTVEGGTGGSATNLPAYLRISSESAGGGGATAWGDITDKPTFNLSWLEDADTTGAIDGTVLKYDEAATEWQVATDDAGGEGSSGPVTLSAGDRDRLDLIWWGVWAAIGVAFAALIAPRFNSLLDVTRGM